MTEVLSGLRQPDRRSCGAACLVATRMLGDPDYAATISPHSFGTEVLALHRQITGARDVLGGWQLPWPRAIGTPPWAVARHLTRTGPAPRRIRLVRVGRGAFDVLAESDLPAALYVGSRWLPRHVVLVTEVSSDRIVCYEPSRGEIVPVARRAVDGRLALAGWQHPWFAVTAP